MSWEFLVELRLSLNRGVKLGELGLSLDSGFEIWRLGFWKLFLPLKVAKGVRILIEERGEWLRELEFSYAIDPSLRLCLRWNLLRCKLPEAGVLSVLSSQLSFNTLFLDLPVVLCDFLTSLASIVLVLLTLEFA